MANEQVDSPPPNSKVESSENFDWRFFPVVGDDISDIYKDNVRYAIASAEDPSNGTTTYEEEKLLDADVSNYNTLINDPETTYLKLEISNGGNSTRTNYHDECLIGSFIISDGKYYEILGQEGGNIIDVSIDDISKTSKLDPVANPEYTIYQQYAWKTVEWYQSISATRFLQGTILNKSGTVISVEIIPSSTPTVFEKSYFNNGVRESISFLDRFSNTYSHNIGSTPRKLYSKYKGWYEFNLSGEKYGIESVVVGTNQVINITLTDDPINFNIGDTVYTLFDEKPYQRDTSHNGTHLVEVNELIPGRGNPDNRICLDGFWLSPRLKVNIPNNTTFGLCGGRYWGLGDEAPDNNNAIAFMRTVSGVLGLSAIYHTRTHEDWILFYDFDSERMNLRRGGPNLTEYPEKYEVSIGLPSSSSSPTLVVQGGSTQIELDEDEERTKSITFDIPNGESLMFFRIGSEDNYYGTFICGDGEMNLLGFAATGTAQDPENFKFDEEIVSPVYEYMKGTNAQLSRKDIKISIATEDSPIIINNGDTNVKNVKVQYVKDNQTVKNANLFDIVQMGDDEMIIAMGKPFGAFTVENPTDPNIGETDASNGIYLIGSKDTGSVWGTPIDNSLDFKDHHQYSLLVLNDVSYCCSQYDEQTDELMIFFVGFFQNETYFGAFIIDSNTLNYQELLCNPENADEQKFVWRPPALEIGDLNHSDTHVEDGFTFSPGQFGFKDTLIKIASVSSNIGASVVIDNVTDFGVVSSMILNDGTYVVLYDAFEGIRMIWSNTTGRSWNSSEIILARNAQSAIWVSGLLIYIVEEVGIISKVVTSSLLNSAMLATAGSSATNIESVQEEFDNQITTSLNTGPVQSQKLAGHEDDTGINHVFYYDNNRKLCSSEGTDVEWTITENF